MIHIFFSAENMGTMPYSFAIIPVLILFILFEIYLLGRREGKFVESLNLIAAVIVLFLALLSLQQVAAEPQVSLFLGGWKPPYGIQISLFLLNAFIAVMLAYCFLVMAVVTRHERLSLHAYPLFLFMFMGAFGVIVSADLFNIFVYLEIMSIASYALASVSEAKERFSSAFNYMVAGAVMTSFYLLGVVLIYSLYGTLNLYDLSTKVHEFGMHLPAVFASICLLMAMFFKSAIFPFYFWKPRVVENTNLAMAVFFGTISPLIPFYISIRFLELFASSQLYLMTFIFGAITMVVASFLAVSSKKFMEVLAYASIFQTGVLFAAYGLGYTHVILKTYALMHFVALFIFELLIFGAIALRHVIGAGFAERFLVLGLMGSVGIPLTAGFIPKLMILIYSFRVDAFLALFFLFFFILSAAYSLKAYTLYSEHHFMITNHNDKRSWPSISLMILPATFLILLGIYPDGIIYIADMLLFSLKNFGV